MIARLRQLSTNRKHFAYKLAYNVFSLFVGFITISFIPRALGVELYGKVNFLKSFFARTLAMSELSIGTGLYTYGSRSPSDRTIMKTYAAFILGIGSAMLVFVFAADAFSVSRYVWPEVPPSLVFVGALAGIALWADEKSLMLLDLKGRTGTGVGIQFGTRTVFLILLGGLYISASLNARSYLWVNAGVFIIATLTIWYVVLQSYRQSSESSRLIDLAKKIVAFSVPLISYTLFSSFAEAADRWMLQKFAGSTQQGIYSLSENISRVIFLITGAAIPVFTREISKLHGRNALAEIKTQVVRVQNALMLVTLYFAAFVAVESAFIVRLLTGDGFNESIFPLSVMALYPVYQVVGQVNGTVFHATLRTSRLRNIGIALAIISLVVTYFTFAPRAMGGLAGGSSAMAIKMLGLNIVGSSVLMFFNFRFLELPFFKTIVSQTILVVSCLFIAVLSKSISTTFVSVEWIRFLLSGVLYTLLFAIFAVAIRHSR